MQSPSPSRDAPALLQLHRSYVVMTAMATLLVLWLVSGRDGVLEAHQVLDASKPTLEGLLTHQLFHTSGIHLLLNLGAILLAGGFLETFWGTRKFIGFSLVVAAGVTAAELAGAGVARHTGVFGGATPASYGASGIALGYLFCLAVAFRERELLRGVSVGQGVWIAILLAAAGLASLDRASLQSAPVEPAPTLLVSQVSGIGVAILFLWLDQSLRRARERREVERRSLEAEQEIDVRGRVDELLDKILARGIGDLTHEERMFLRDASKHYRKSRD